MRIVLSSSGVPIRLTPERMDHIRRRHPEMVDQEETILETLIEPDLVQEGDAGTRIALKHYRKSPLTEKFCAVVYREVSERNGFVIRAYYCARYAGVRRILWRR